LFHVVVSCAAEQPSQQQNFVSLTPATTFPLAQSGNANASFRDAQIGNSLNITILEINKHLF
jgi:hypothetical protein